ncbi:MAG: DUF4981 domain-containing protein [Erysipelotrichaceae bacterium]|nr:DUF4981 domain-containing protein [Erysipelotrichaceae bacterium]
MRKADAADLRWLEQPDVFAVNRLDAHSDHAFFQKEPGDLTLSLNGTWKVDVAENPDGRKADFYKDGFDDSDFAEIKVPGHLQTQGFLNNHYTNTIYPWDGIDELRPPHISWKHNVTASYVTEFDLPENEADFNKVLTFHGVETAFYVWVNGKFVGYAEDSFTPSHFDITPYVTPKGNRLCVEVYQRSSASWLEDQDMWRLTGIFRDVEISLIPKIHIIDVATVQDVDLENGSAGLKVTLKNRVEAAGTVEAFLIEDGKVIASASAEAAEKMEFDFQVEDVKLWSAEYPNLYTLAFKVTSEGSVMEEASLQIGFRKFGIENGIMMINGKRIQFHGMNRHEFDLVNGRAMPRDIMDWDAAFMKKNNINAVRTSHYPNSSYWYDLADRFGIYLIDETNLETHGTWQKLGVLDPEWTVPDSKPEWKEAVLDRARNMYERDKNHPSIVIWSVGNEAYGGTNHIAMHDFFHEVDPSRPVHYEGTTWCREFSDATDIESRMYAKPWEIEEYLQNDPQKPYISCEYEHAMGNSLGNMQDYLDLEKYPHFQGGFIWDYVDQAIKTDKGYFYGGDFDDFPNDGNFSGDGVLFADRTETPKTPEMKQLYRYVKINPAVGDKNGVSLLNEYLFTNLSEFDFAYVQKSNGDTVAEGTFAAAAAPGEEVFVELPWVKPKAAGIDTYTVVMKLKEDTSWAKAGHELAFGETVEDNRVKSDHTGTHAAAAGDGNMGVYGDGFAYYFQYQKGLVSMKLNGKEYLSGPVKPDFYRALTDNDEGAGYGQSAGIWMSAGHYAAIKSWDHGTNEDGSIWMKYVYGIPFVNLEAELTYTVYGDGYVSVNLEMDTSENTPLLPAFGMRFLLKGELNEVSWLGKGPQETYCDRDHARTDVYSSSVADQFTTYLRPQECGNHMGTYKGTLSCSCGCALTFEAEGTPLQFSALPWTPEQIALANHPYELPESHKTIVRVLSEQMGVGGDDTWGAPVHDEWLIKTGGRLTCRFGFHPGK